MTKTTTPQQFSSEDSSIEDCNSLLVCLNSRRFVVVRVDEPKNFWPVNGGWEQLRKLKPGDEVIYKGDRTTVRAMDVYQ